MTCFSGPAAYSHGSCFTPDLFDLSKVIRFGFERAALVRLRAAIWHLANWRCASETVVLAPPFTASLPRVERPPANGLFAGAAVIVRKTSAELSQASPFPQGTWLTPPRQADCLAA